MTLLDNSADSRRHLRNPTPWQVARAFRTEEPKPRKASKTMIPVAPKLDLGRAPLRRRSINWAVAALVAFALPFAMATVLKLRADQNQIATSAP